MTIKLCFIMTGFTSIFTLLNQVKYYHNSKYPDSSGFVFPASPFSRYIELDKGGIDPFFN